MPSSHSIPFHFLLSLYSISLPFLLPLFPISSHVTFSFTPVSRQLPFMLLFPIKPQTPTRYLLLPLLGAPTVSPLHMSIFTRLYQSLLYYPSSSPSSLFSICSSPSHYLTHSFILPFLYASFPRISLLYPLSSSSCFLYGHPLHASLSPSSILPFP